MGEYVILSAAKNLTCNLNGQSSLRDASSQTTLLSMTMQVDLFGKIEHK